MTAASSSDLPGQRSLGLDLLRVLAAAWVVLFHWGMAYGNPDALPAVLGGLVRGGYLGVDLFFLLSGAVIAHSALNRSWVGFARPRFLRLFPAYLASAILVLGTQTLAAALKGAEIDVDPNDVLGLSGLVLWTGGDLIIGPSWTLFHEVHFYMLVTVLIIVTRNALTTGRMLGAAYIYIALWLVASVSDTQLLDVVLIYKFGPLFLLGMMIGISTSVELLKRHSPALLLALVMTVYVLIGRTGEMKISGGEQAVWIAAFLVPTVAVMLWSSLRRPVRPGAARVRRWVQTLALMTYPIYLLHFEFGKSVIRRISGVGAPLTVSLAATLAIILLISWLSVRYYEPFARRLLRRAFGWDEIRPAPQSQELRSG